MNTLFKKSAFLILVCGATLLPHSVSASTVYIDTSQTEYVVGDTLLLRVRVDSENKNINTVEGTVLLNYAQGAVSLVDINTAGSPFTLWPNTPFPSEDNSSISFVGGSPGGLVTKDAILFNLALQLKEEGQIIVSPNNVGVYLNDGQGTRDNVSTQNVVLNVLPRTTDTPPSDDWNSIISGDKTAPASFDIDLGRDPSLFDNQYFISFFTTDAESGIAYYEVQEGEGDFIRAESPYVLLDQSLSGVIKVKAVDKAGNERVEKFIPVVAPAADILMDKNLLLGIGAGLLILIVVTALLWKAFGRKR